MMIMKIKKYLIKNEKKFKLHNHKMQINFMVILMAHFALILNLMQYGLWTPKKCNIYKIQNKKYRKRQKNTSDLKKKQDEFIT